MDNWIFASAVMFSLSVLMYLLTRKLQVAGVDNRLVTFSMGALPMPLLLIYLLATGQSFAIELGLFALLGVCAILFSYLGFKFSFLGTKHAPNPGYSLTIQKSYAPYTAIMGIFLFNQSISIIGVVAILVIIGSIALILINKSAKKVETDNKWVVESFIAFFLFGTLSLTSKFFLGQGVTPLLLTFYNFTFNIFAFSIDFREVLKINILKEIKKSNLLIMLIVAAATAAFNIAMFTAIKTAPNIGYVNIINSSSITAITLLSALFFKDKLTLQKVIGVIGVTCGLILLFI